MYKAENSVDILVKICLHSSKCDKNKSVIFHSPQCTLL